MTISILMSIHKRENPFSLDVALREMGTIRCKEPTFYLLKQDIWQKSVDFAHPTKRAIEKLAMVYFIANFANNSIAL